MDEQELRSQAALQELNAINQILTQRCVNLAADHAVLKVAAERALAALKAQEEKVGEELKATTHKSVLKQL